ncbi:unnamed protein product [Adineta steineri]|uniref:Uncharacterized protein n=1 Tax=Adineta steineri TaxID=433720 RepID=A0A814XQ71_9BILA|nr:unnamed protein product [Adineta steineri]CAF1257764.1 unnamed protein product [Adineta steineri]CAF3521365.1 unnamed protein product [Adineta steineri]CAF3585887.1 unnamed protein product [Adineta steineri]
MYSKWIPCGLLILLVFFAFNVQGFGLYNALQRRSDAANFLRLKRDLGYNYCTDIDCSATCPCGNGYCWGKNICTCFQCSLSTISPAEEGNHEPSRRRR